MSVKLFAQCASSLQLKAGRRKPTKHAQAEGGGGIEGIRHFCLFSLVSFVLFACSATPQAGTANLITSFYNMSDSQFSIRAIGPANAVRELAICKAVWFAAKKHAPLLSMSNPAYSAPGVVPTYGFGKVPTDWVALTATAYLTAPNPDRNPVFTVAEKVPACRAAWGWYR